MRCLAAASNKGQAPLSSAPRVRERDFRFPVCGSGLPAEKRLPSLRSTKSLACCSTVRRPCNALKGERRRLVPHVGGIRSAERALGEGPKAAFYVRPAVIDSQIFSRTGSLSRRCPTCSSLRRNPPSGPALPGLGGVDLFLPSCRPKEGRSRLFDGRTWAVSIPRP
jgi:hypothetical protein